jgi:hypothetical protein
MPLTTEIFAALLEAQVERLIVVEDNLFTRCQETRDGDDYKLWLSAQDQLRLTANHLLNVRKPRREK